MTTNSEQSETENEEVADIPPSISVTANIDEEQLEKFADSIWNVSHFFYWPEVKFTDRDVLQNKTLIAEALLKYKNINCGFKILLERTIVTALSEKLKKEVRHTLPPAWFNIRYPKGLSSQYIFIEVQSLYDSSPQSEQRILSEKFRCYLVYPREKNLALISEELLSRDLSHLLQILFDFISHYEIFNHCET